MPAAPPDNPAGPFQMVDSYDEQVKSKLLETLREAPENLRQAVHGLTAVQLDTRYKNWTIRQITHHLADSHLHSLIRFKWALSEDHPTIKAYEEADWVELTDSKIGDIGPALAMFGGLHAKWVQVLESITAAQFERTFFHPQSNESVSLWTALNYYPWHCQHHSAQIVWLRKQNGWL